MNNCSLDQMYIFEGITYNIIYIPLLDGNIICPKCTNLECQKQLFPGTLRGIFGEELINELEERIEKHMKNK